MNQPFPQSKAPGQGEDGDLLRFLSRTINAMAGEFHLSADSARSLAAGLVAKVRAQFGSTSPYIRAPGREPRNQDILADHDRGLSHREIAKKHGVHQTTVGRIIARHRLPEPSRRPSQGAGLGRDGWNL